MISVSLISKIRRLKQWIKCEFKRGHTFVVKGAFGDLSGLYDVLLECKYYGKEIWIRSMYRPQKGMIVKDFNRRR